MLNPEEKKALDQTSELWNTMAKMPAQHPDDMNEFKFHIHAIQRIIAMRGVRRANPDRFTNIGNDKRGQIEKPTFPKERTELTGWQRFKAWFNFLAHYDMDR